MCGIFCLLNSKGEDKGFVKRQFDKCQNRGPEQSKLFFDREMYVYLGFHRLPINGLDEISNQPMTIDNNITLICNGEIYNYKELFELMDITTPETNSDCEVILHLYKRYGIEQTLQMLDGVFGFIIYDFRDVDNKKIYAARDPYGVRPLFKLHTSKGYIGFASLLVNLSKWSERNVSLGYHESSWDEEHSLKENIQRDLLSKSLQQFEPGTYSGLIVRNTKWVYDIENKSYSHFGFMEQPEYDNCDEFNLNLYLNGIREYFTKAVQKRVENTDRPVACLLSGGLDSSLVAALVNQHHKGELETYSIGMPGSEDLKYARKVADHLGTKHTEIVVSEDDFFNAIPDVVKATETWDTTTNRASVGNWLLGKYISEHSEAKVIFNGDGSDELSGGYMYFHKAPDQIEFDKECRRLLSNIHYFDVLRSDRCIACHGLETRTPFLDRAWVQYYLSIPKRFRFHTLKDLPEKFLIRKAFDSGLLPKEVIWRTKEAFSDGVSSLKKSWFQIIDEKVSHVTDFKTHEPLLKLLTPTPVTPEQMYYRYLFEKNYPGCGNVVPYYWMPRYVDATDSSARTLAVFKQAMEKGQEDE